MVLIQNFHSTSLWKAFILNSIITSLVILIAITIKAALDNYIQIDDNDISNKNTIKRKTSLYNIVVTLLITFFITLLSYLIMYIIFGFGGGMLVEN